MPHLEPPVEASLSTVGDPLAIFLPWLELRDVLRQTLQIAGVSSALGWPRLLTPELAARWFSGPQLLCTFADASDLDAATSFVGLPVNQAVALADLCLGGEGRAGVACEAGAPDEAECGVLAYVAARCVRICAPALRLRDVATRRASELTGWPEGTLLWPLRIKLGAGVELELALLLPSDSALAQRPLKACLAIAEELDATTLATLGAGDLLVCESWPGHLTSQGLSGALELGTEAFQGALRVALEAGRIRKLASTGSAVRSGKQARLVLTELTLRFADLAGLASGSAEFPVAASELAYLELDGQARAHGKLVRYRGAIALEVLGLGAAPSMR
jgi:hypothetical protein